MFHLYNRCEVGMGSYNQLCRCSSGIVLQLILHCSISRLARAHTLDQLRLAQLACLTCGSNHRFELSKEKNLLPPRLRGRRQGPVPSTELWPTYNMAGHGQPFQLLWHGHGMGHGHDPWTMANGLCHGKGHGICIDTGHGWAMAWHWPSTPSSSSIYSMLRGQGHALNVCYLDFSSPMQNQRDCTGLTD